MPRHAGFADEDDRYDPHGDEVSDEEVDWEARTSPASRARGSHLTFFLHRSQPATCVLAVPLTTSRASCHTACYSRVDGHCARAGGPSPTASVAAPTRRSGDRVRGPRGLAPCALSHKREPSCPFAACFSSISPSPG